MNMTTKLLDNSKRVFTDRNFGGGRVMNAVNGMTGKRVKANLYKVRVVGKEIVVENKRCVSEIEEIVEKGNGQSGFGGSDWNGSEKKEECVFYKKKVGNFIR